MANGDSNLIKIWTIMKISIFSSIRPNAGDCLKSFGIGPVVVRVAVLNA